MNTTTTTTTPTPTGDSGLISPGACTSGIGPKYTHGSFSDTPKITRRLRCQLNLEQHTHRSDGGPLPASAGQCERPLRDGEGAGEGEPTSMRRSPVREIEETGGKKRGGGVKVSAEDRIQNHTAASKGTSNIWNEGTRSKCEFI